MAKGLYTPQICIECSKSFKSVLSLARHLTQTHPLTTKQYFDKHLKSPEDGVCSNCQVQTTFLNLGSGYKKVCGHSCAATIFRAEQNMDSPGWKGRVQITPIEQLNLHLERIGVKDCMNFGIDPGSSAWNTSQTAINKNLAQTFEMTYG